MVAISMFIYAKDCNKNVWKVTGPFPFAPILDFKMTAI